MDSVSCFLDSKNNITWFKGDSKEVKACETLHYALNYLITLNELYDITVYTPLNDSGEKIIHDLMMAGCVVLAKSNRIPKFVDDLHGKKKMMVYNATKKNISDMAVSWQGKGIIHLINSVNICEYAPDSADDVRFCVEWFKLHCGGADKVSGAAYAFDAFKKTVDFSSFPTLPEDLYNTLSAGIVGGWNYINPVYEGKVVENITVLDKNSMYADFLRHCYLPFGLPVNSPVINTDSELLDYIHELPRDKFVFIDADIKLFSLKPGCYPFITDTRTHLFPPNKYLSDTGVVNPFDKDSTPEYMPIEVVLTAPEYKLMAECYDYELTKVNQVITFNAAADMFKRYIDTFYAEKAAAADSPAARYCAKKCLTSVLGKFCKPLQFEVTLYSIDRDNPDSLTSEIVYQPTKGSYLPVYVAAVSLARVDIIRDAISCGAGFCYSDTDSLHITGEVPEDLPISNDLGCFKIESEASRAIYIKRKAYILQLEVSGEYKIKIAGMQGATAEWLNNQLTGGNIGLSELRAGFHFTAPDNHGELLEFTFHADI